MACPYSRYFVDVLVTTHDEWSSRSLSLQSLWRPVLRGHGASRCQGHLGFVVGNDHTLSCEGNSVCACFSVVCIRIKYGGEFNQENLPQLASMKKKERVSVHAGFPYNTHGHISRELWWSIASTDGGKKLREVGSHLGGHSPEHCYVPKHLDSANSVVLVVSCSRYARGGAAVYLLSWATAYQPPTRGRLMAKRWVSPIAEWDLCAATTELEVHRNTLSRSHFLENRWTGAMVSSTFVCITLEHTDFERRRLHLLFWRLFSVSCGARVGNFTQRGPPY